MNSNGVQPDAYSRLLALADSWGAVVADERESLVEGGATLGEKDVCKAIGIDVLGELPNGRVLVYSLHHKKCDELRDVDRLKYPRLLRLCGPAAKEKVHGGHGDVPGMHRMGEVREAIEMLAGYHQLSPQDLIGDGCWRGVDENGKESDDVVIVSGNQAMRWNCSGELHLIPGARHGGLVMDLGARKGPIDVEAAKLLLEKFDPEFGQRAIKDATELFGRWRWRDQETNPQVVTGALMATLVQTCWRWRPHVAITGKTNSGKSFLFEALRLLLGPMAVKFGQYSAAGVRQNVGRSAKAIFLDEFERSQHRASVLEMMRASSRGDELIWGSANQSGKRYTFRHIFWVAAIEAGITRAPDRNRFIELELLAAEDGEFGKLRLPSYDEARDLGRRLLVTAIHSAIEASDLAVKLKELRVEDVDPRIVESYAVVASILSVGSGGQIDAENALRTILANVERGCRISDEDDLLESVLSAPIRMSGGREKTVAEIVREDSDWDAYQAMERCGVAIVNSSPGPRQHSGGDKSLFFDAEVILQRILTRTGWADKDIRKILMRVDGASAGRRRISGRLARGVLIPMELIRSEFLGEGTLEH